MPKSLHSNIRNIYRLTVLSSLRKKLYAMQRGIQISIATSHQCQYKHRSKYSLLITLAAKQCERKDSKEIYISVIGTVVQDH